MRTIATAISKIIWHLSLFLLSFTFAVTQNLWLPSFQAFAQPSAQIAILNSFTPGTTNAGVNSTYRLLFRNSTGSVITITSLNHTLVNTPGPVFIASSIPSANTCGGAGTVTLNSGTEPNLGGGGGASGSYSISGFTIPTGAPGQCFIEFPVRGYVAGNHTDTIPAGALVTNVGSNADPTSSTLQINGFAAATIGKAFSPSTIPGDGRATATITITNPNNFALTGTTSTPTLVDTLPSSPSQLFVDTRSGAPAPATTCTGGVASISTDLPANTKIQLVGGTIPANGSCTITFPVTSANSGTYTNDIPANSLSTQNRITNSNAPTANLAVQNEVTIAKSGLGNNLVEGQRQRIVITINNGGSQLTGLTVTDPLGTNGYLEIDPNPNATTTCIAGGASTAWATQPTVGATSFTFNSTALGQPAIVPGANPSTNTIGSCTISVNVRVRTGAIGNLPNPQGTNSDINTISNTVANFNNDQGRLPTAPATNAFNVVSGLISSKTYFNASGQTTSIAPGSTVQVRIRVRYQLSTANSTSPPTLTGLTYTDNLPSSAPGGQQLIVANPPNAAFTPACGTPTFAPVAGATSVTLSNASIVPSNNASNEQNVCQVSFDVQAPATTPIGANFDNIIANNTILNDQGFDSNAITGTEGRLTTVSRVNITKAFSPNPVGRGLPSQLTITIQNNRRSVGGTPEPLTNIAITDDLTTNTPIPNLQVANPPNLNNTCNGTISGATAGSTTVSLAGGSITPNGSCTIQFNVIEIDRTNANFPPPVNYDNTPSGFSNAEAEPATLPTARLTVTSPLTGVKSFQSPAITANGISRATIEFRNTDPIPLTNLSFTDSWVQANTQIATNPDFDTTCAGGTFTYNAAINRRSFSFAGGQVPPQVGGIAGLCRVSFDVVMDATGANSFTNTLPTNTVTTAEGFRNPTNISGTLNRVTNNLTIIKNFAPLDLNSVGDPSVLTVTIANPGTGGLVANNLTFVDTMDTLSSEILVFPVPSATTSCGGTVLLPGSPRPAGYAGAATLAANEFGLTGGIITAGGNCVITIRTTRNTAGSRTNTIPIGNITTREGTSNTSASSSTLNALPALDVTKAFLPTSVAGGQISRLTVTVQNRQASGELGGPLTNVRFTDNLPTNLRVAPVPNVATTCTNGVFNPALTGGEVTFTLASFDLAFNSSCTASIDVVSNIANSYVNTITPAQVQGTLQTSLNTPSGNPQTTTSNGNATDTLTVTSSVLPPEIVLVKRITRINGTDISGFVDDGTTTLDNDARWPSPNSDSLRGAVTISNVRPQDEVEYTIYYLNRGQANANNVRICDPVPANTVYIANAFNGSSPTDGGLPADLGIVLQTGTTVGDRRYLTGINDGDRGRYYDPTIGEVTPSTGSDRCVQPDNPTLPITTNPNGIVTVNVTRTTGAPTFPNVPNATASGVPPSSYGFVRFKVRVK